MLSFAARTIDPQVLLANTNELTKFTPNKSTNNTLTISNDGNIQVTTRKVIPPQLYDLMARLSLNNEANEDAFAQEKLILIWHCTQLLPYLSQRLEHLQSMSKDNLLDYYDLSMRYQGFYQLCNNLSLQLGALKQLINDAEHPQNKHWSTQFNLAQQQLNTDMDKLLTSAREFMNLISHSRKTILSTVTPVFDFQVVPVPRFILSRRQMPLRYEIGSLTLTNKQYKVEAHFETYRKTWDTPTEFPFSGKICIELSEGAEKLDTSLKTYLSRTHGKVPTAKASKWIDFPKDCATGFLKDIYSSRPFGAISLEPVALCASFTHFCRHVQTNELLPYLVTLVDIAKSQHVSGVTVYAPYSYSAILLGLGLKLTPTDNEHPTNTEIEGIVTSCMDQGINVPLLPQGLNKATDDGDPIWRPFCLDVDFLETTPVYLTSQRKIKNTQN